MKWISLFLLTLTAPLWGQSFLPENNLHLEDSFYGQSNMDEYDFNEVMREIGNIYKPIVRKFGATLKIQGDWDDGTVNAYATQYGSTWIVQMFGGLARRPEITKHGFAAVVCHELGHHLGGFPKVSSWAANEGQSDYFSAHACLRKYYSLDDSYVEYLDGTAIEICKEAYNGKARNTCYHVMSAIESVSALLSYLSGRSAEFDSYDPTKASRTYNRHPNAQCRLDTMVAAILCKKRWDDQVIPYYGNQSRYNCTAGTGARPRCWYAP